MSSKDADYLKIVLKPIQVCVHYRPKFGQGTKGGGLTLEQFRHLYQADPFYSWFGLDNPLMYAAHKAAGGMTSVYRQIGIGCETLFRTILSERLGISSADVTWSYDVAQSEGKNRKLSLDGKVELQHIPDNAARSRFKEWMRACGDAMEVDRRINQTLAGTVFEVRQGYKSKDSKRQNADIANAAYAYTQAFLPCAVILSNQIDGDVLTRYRMQKWVVLTGIEGINDPMVSTYDFMREVVGYDLAGFFKRNTTSMQAEIDAVLKALLAPETT